MVKRWHPDSAGLSGKIITGRIKMENKAHVNVGMIDAFIRLAAGFTMLGVGSRNKCWIVTFIGSMKIAEGFTRFCPLLYLLGKNTLHWKCGREDE